MFDNFVYWNKSLQLNKESQIMSQLGPDHLMGIDSLTGNPTILLKKEYFEQNAVMKTLKLFSNKVLCQMLPEGESEVKITFLSARDNEIDLEVVRDDFYIAVIDQQVREDILKKTASVQKAIYEAAFLPITTKVD